MRGSDVWPTCAQSVTTNNGVKMTKYTIIFSYYLWGGAQPLYTNSSNNRDVYEFASCIFVCQLSIQIGERDAPHDDT